MSHIKSTFAFLATSLLCFSCSSSQADGTVQIAAYGESFIEDGIPASAFADGWEVSFESFTVTFESVSVGSQSLGVLEAVDLSEPSQEAGQRLGELSLPPDDYSEPSFAISRIEVQGEGKHEELTKSFHWVFEVPTLYDACETTISVQSEQSSTFQLTVHADHLFADSLVSEEPRLMFAPLAAADLDEDGTISEAELLQTDIGAYDPGSDNDAKNLWDFLSAQAQTLGHVDGEGHCHAEAAD